MKKTLIIILTGLLISVSTFVARADYNSERAKLSLIVQELKNLEVMIQEAEAHKDLDARVKFRYDWLRHDIKSVMDGLQIHIDGPRMAPRKFEPLKGDYRR